MGGIQFNLQQIAGTSDARTAAWIRQSSCPSRARRLTLNKQNPRISVGDKCDVDNYIIGSLLRWIGQKDDSRVTFKLSSHRKEAAPQRWRSQDSRQRKCMPPGGKTQFLSHCSQQSLWSTNGFLSFSEFKYSFKNDLPKFGLLVGSFLSNYGEMEQ